MVEDFSAINGEGTILRKAQLRALDILIELDKICKKHGIEYWLIGGTLLGAVRHGGFIPWDDDIDVSIQHKDLKKLKKILKNELPKKFVIQDNSEDKNYYIESIFRIRDKKSFMKIDSHLSFKEQGLVVDIIPMEKMPSMKFKRFIFNLNKNPYLRSKELSISGKSSNILGLLLFPISKGFIKFAHWYSKVNSTSKFGYNYLFWLGPCFEMQFEMSIIFPLKTVRFEDKEFLAPNKIDTYLTLAYGDYMRIPELKQRQIHSSHIEFYD